MSIIKDELIEVKEKYGDERRSKIEYAGGDFSMEDMIPNKKVVGLSKLARTVEVFSKRLQTQERLTMQVAKTLMNALDAKGVAVTVDAAHQCMTMRGIKKEKATTVTNYFLGTFREDLSIQNRYLRYIAK